LSGNEVPLVFDNENRYIKVQKNNIEYVKIRLMDSNNWGAILTTILQVPITIVNDYETKNKPIKTLYKEFKENYKLPQNYVDLLLNDPTLDYYLTETEKQQYVDSFTQQQLQYIITDNWEPYTREEYELYISISLENQYYSSIQLHHYKDDGCLCVLCKKQRETILQKINNSTIDVDTLRVNHDITTATEKENKINQINQINQINMLTTQVIINRKKSLQNKKDKMPSLQGPKVFRSPSIQVASDMLKQPSIVNSIRMNIKKR